MVMVPMMRFILTTATLHQLQKATNSNGASAFTNSQFITTAGRQRHPTIATTFLNASFQHRNVYTPSRSQNYRSFAKLKSNSAQYKYLQFRSSFRHRTFSMLKNSANDDDNDTEELRMENIYQEWTIEDDTLLYESMKSNSNLPQMAAILGRGLRGVETRIAKLKDPNSSVYQRLFVGDKLQKSDSDAEADNDVSGGKLTPVKEVMRRVQWDYSLSPKDFTVIYWDRVEETLMSSPFDATNDSVKGREEMFVFAIPEHRIQSVKYKEQVVWDKQKRLDRVFGSMNGRGETIDQVMEGYDEWKRKEEELQAYNRQRQREMAIQIRSILGEHLFMALKDISATLQSKATGMSDEESTQKDIEDYVQDAIFLFRQSRNMASSENTNNIHDVSDNGSIPHNDIESLDMFSNLVALLPDDALREKIMQEVFKQANKMDPHRAREAFATSTSSSDDDSNKNNKQRKNSNDQHQQLPPLIDDELTETFVRGSGAGGQKVNKTANKVLLIHNPTQVRVECQDTRSLQQNRKIARKRLALKLDEYRNGSQSKTQKKNAVKASKKQKAKARSRARARKRELELKQDQDQE